MGADDRLHGALRDWRDPAATFIPLFETLNWLVAIDDRLRAEGHIWDPRAGSLLAAFRYVRGRVHHQWAEAFELRNDIELERVWLGLSPQGQQYWEPPGPITDWCWRQTSELPTADKPQHERGLDDYAEHLAGEPVRRVIGQVRDGLITPLWIASGGEQWPPAARPI